MQDYRESVEKFWSVSLPDATSDTTDIKSTSAGQESIGACNSQLAGLSQRGFENIWPVPR